jgi:membrane protein YqaA with SNARE-associated domain
MTSLATYAGLFVVALGAASLLPLQSEPLLVGLLLLAEEPAWLLVLVASLGNTLGACVNWALGRGVERFRDRRWFPVPAAQLSRAEGWYRRWGRWSLLLSWAPIIGDPLTLVAGVLREPLLTFVILVAIAKTARYLVLAAATLGLA